MIVILLGLMTQGIRVTDVKVEFMAYLGILLTQVGTQFIKDIFEESVWRAYLTNQLIELKLPDLKLYLLVGFIWWIWHLPYIMKLLSEREIQNTLPVGRFTFFLIGMITVVCWTDMYTEIFRITKSVTITILCLGRKKSSFPLLAFSGDDSDYSLSTRRPSYTEMEKKTGVWKGELTE